MDHWMFPSRDLVLENDQVRLSPVRVPDDLEALYEAASVQSNGEDLFRYHVNVPTMDSLETFRHYLTAKLALGSEVTYQVFGKRLGRAVGCVSLMNVRTDHGTVEVGSIWYAKAAQRTEVNTNTMALLFRYVFEDLKYRRLEWKCNNENEASKRAALRLGFVPEGLFRQHFISRGQNRDTAWYSIIDREWPAVAQSLSEKTQRIVP